MRGAVLMAPGSIDVREFPMPTVSDGCVLIETIEVAICASETDRFSGQAPITEPTFLGHEVVGRVVETSGTGPAMPEIGDFAVPWLEPMHGAAEFMAVPVNRIVPFGAVMPQSAVLTEPLGCAIGSVHTSKVGPEDSVVISGGTGAIGELIRMYLNVQFPDLKNVFVLGRSVQALRRAAKDGRTRAIDVSGSVDDAVAAVRDATGGRGAEVVLEVSGVPSLMSRAADFARGQGTVGFVGYPPGGVTLNMRDICSRAISLRTCHFRDQEVKHKFMREGAALLVKGSLQPHYLLTHRLPFTDVVDAFKLAASRDSTKVVLGFV